MGFLGGINQASEAAARAIIPDKSAKQDMERAEEIIRSFNQALEDQHEDYDQIWGKSIIHQQALVLLDEIYINALQVYRSMEQRHEDLEGDVGLLKGTMGWSAGLGVLASADPKEMVIATAIPAVGVGVPTTLAAHRHARHIDHGEDYLQELKEHFTGVSYALDIIERVRTRMQDGKGTKLGVEELEDLRQAWESARSILADISEDFEEDRDRAS